MNGIIWYYTNKEIGLNRFEQLIKDYRRIRVEVVHRTKDKVEFDNGDSWRVIPARDISRGHACNIGLIERGTPDDIIHTLIMPCINSCPYQGYNYY